MRITAIRRNYVSMFNDVVVVTNLLPTKLTPHECITSCHHITESLFHAACVTRDVNIAHVQPQNKTTSDVRQFVTSSFFPRKWRCDTVTPSFQSMLRSGWKSLCVTALQVAIATVYKLCNYLQETIKTYLVSAYKCLTAYFHIWEALWVMCIGDYTINWNEIHFENIL